MKHNQLSGYAPNDNQELCRVILEELNEIKTKSLYYELCNNNKFKYILNTEFHLI